MPSVGNGHSQDGTMQMLSLQWTYGGRPWGLLNLNALLPLNILELRIFLLKSMGPQILISSDNKTNDWFQVKFKFKESPVSNISVTDGSISWVHQH